MPQEIRGLQCPECNMYQVNLVKKGCCCCCNGYPASLEGVHLKSPVVLRREQQILSPKSIKCEEKEFASKVESDNKESNVHNHQTKNNDSTLEDKVLSEIKWPNSNNKRLMRIDSNPIALKNMQMG